MGALSTSRQNISDRNFRFSAKIGFSTKSIPIPSQSYAVCRAERLYEAGSYQIFFKSFIGSKPAQPPVYISHEVLRISKVDSGQNFNGSGITDNHDG